MKRLLFGITIGVSVLLLTANNLYAQDDEETKPLIIQTNYVSTSAEARMVNLDSLLKIWKERVMNPNPYFVSAKIVRHWWGLDSRQVIFIFELKSWDDIEKAFEKRNEIMKAHKGWANEEDLKAFGKMWRSVLMNDSHHSDEIYQVVGE